MYIYLSKWFLGVNFWAVKIVITVGVLVQKMSKKAPKGGDQADAHLGRENEK